MANGETQTKPNLLNEIEQLQQENQDLQNVIDTIADVIAQPDQAEDDEADRDYDED
jgi:hypothetical protein